LFLPSTKLDPRSCDIVKDSAGSDRCGCDCVRGSSKEPNFCWVSRFKMQSIETAPNKRRQLHDARDLGAHSGRMRLNCNVVGFLAVGHSATEAPQQRYQYCTEIAQLGYSCFLRSSSTASTLLRPQLHLFFCFCFFPPTPKVQYQVAEGPLGHALLPGIGTHQTEARFKLQIPLPNRTNSSDRNMRRRTCSQVASPSRASRRLGGNCRSSCFPDLRESAGWAGFRVWYGMEPTRHGDGDARYVV